MSRRTHLTPAGIRRILLAVLLVVATAVLVRYLRDTAPVVTLDPVAPAQRADDPNLVTCERTIADDPEAQREVERAEAQVLGRVTASGIIECPDAFDGQVVDYLGEVVGDVLGRRDGAWLLVNDDAYALEAGPLSGHREFAGGNTGLAVWVPDPVPDLVPGGHDRRGTIIQVRGRIMRADPADGGGLTLRALSGQDVQIVREAESARPPVHVAQALVALLFAAAAAVITMLARRSTEQR